MRKRRPLTRQTQTDNRLRRALSEPPAVLALVCESNPDRCTALERALEPLGTLASVWSRGDVLEAAVRERPRIVVFGIGIAKLGGFATPRRLRALAPHVHLVVVTWGALPIAFEHRDLFSAVVEDEHEAAANCARL